MPALKKITDTIAEDMRKQYASGEATQAELADLFKVSVPTVNKTVKGVKPEKRKYKTNPAKSERDSAIVAEYNPDNGMGMKELAVKYNMTHQNVSLILKAGGVNPQVEYFGKLKVQSEARKERVQAEKLEKQDKRKEKLERLSELWKSGCSIEQFRDAAGLKSSNAAQVKIVHLRKKNPEAFPLRSNRSSLSDDERADKVAELSRLYLEDPTKLSALAAVFGEKESSVQRRICQLRALENGNQMFPRRRNRKEKVVVSDEVKVGEEQKEMVDGLEFSAEIDEMVDGLAD